MIGSGPILRGGIWSGHRARLPKPMRSLKSLIQALAVLAALALVLIALGYCFAQFFIGGAL